jgi:fanconi-associated nuclease 1
VICQTLAEDYAARTSGVPDLIVWKLEDHECRFVEVKGPGDTERENQKVRNTAVPLLVSSDQSMMHAQIWMDVLMRAGVTAEVCRVQEHGHVEKKKAKKKRKRKRKAEEDTINPDLMVADFEEEAPWEDDNGPYDMDVEPEPAEEEDIVIRESPKRPAENKLPPPTPKRRRQVEVVIISPRRRS